MDTSDDWIRTRSGLQERRYAAPGQGSGSTDLGAIAARAAIADASLAPADIEAVVFPTMTPDHLLPDKGPLLQAALGLRTEKVPHDIERYGNPTAATLPILHHECLKEGRIEPGALVAFTALGSGLHWGAALYRA